MKKKHRDITVEGVKYGWITKILSETKSTTRVFKDKKEWFSFDTTGIVYPVDVKTLIRKQLAK